MSVGLRIEVEEIEDKILLRVTGRLDAASSPILERKIENLVKDDHNKMILDFSQVEYLSSAGMRLLLSDTKKLKAKGGSLVLFSITEEVMEIIKMAGFERILNVCKSEQEALQF